MIAIPLLCDEGEYDMDEIYSYALKLLRGRDYTVLKLCEKLQSRFGAIPPQVVERLLEKNFLNDRRFAENYVAKWRKRGGPQLREQLAARGVPAELADEIVSGTDLPSLQQALEARMKDWRLRFPLQLRDAARLFRALARLGYDEDAIREEIERSKNEQ
jgi:SOS response regulatory protein OraA/RecX